MIQRLNDFLNNCFSVIPKSAGSCCEFFVNIYFFCQCFEEFIFRYSEIEIETQIPPPRNFLKKVGFYEPAFCCTQCTILTPLIALVVIAVLLFEQSSFVFTTSIILSALWMVCLICLFLRCSSVILIFLYYWQCRYKHANGIITTLREQLEQEMEEQREMEEHQRNEDHKRMVEPQIFDRYDTSQNRYSEEINIRHLSPPRPLSEPKTGGTLEDHHHHSMNERSNSLGGGYGKKEEELGVEEDEKKMLGKAPILGYFNHIQLQCYGTNELDLRYPTTPIDNADNNEHHHHEQQQQQEEEEVERVDIPRLLDFEINHKVDHIIQINRSKTMGFTSQITQPGKIFIYHLDKCRIVGEIQIVASSQLYDVIIHDLKRISDDFVYIMYHLTSRPDIFFCITPKVSNYLLFDEAKLEEGRGMKMKKREEQLENNKSVVVVAAAAAAAAACDDDDDDSDSDSDDEKSDRSNEEDWIKQDSVQKLTFFQIPELCCLESSGLGTRKAKKKNKRRRRRRRTRRRPRREKYEEEEEDIIYEDDGDDDDSAKRVHLFVIKAGRTVVFCRLEAGTSVLHQMEKTIDIPSDLPSSIFDIRRLVVKDALQIFPSQRNRERFPPKRMFYASTKYFCKINYEPDKSFVSQAEIERRRRRRICQTKEDESPSNNDDNDDNDIELLLLPPQQQQEEDDETKKEAELFIKRMIRPIEYRKHVTFRQFRIEKFCGFLKLKTSAILICRQKRHLSERFMIMVDLRRFQIRRQIRIHCDCTNHIVNEVGICQFAKPLIINELNLLVCPISNRSGSTVKIYEFFKDRPYYLEEFQAYRNQAEVMNVNCSFWTDDNESGRFYIVYNGKWIQKWRVVKTYDDSRDDVITKLLDDDDDMTCHQSCIQIKFYDRGGRGGRNNGYFQMMSMLEKKRKKKMKMGMYKKLEDEEEVEGEGDSDDDDEIESDLRSEFVIPRLFLLF